MEKRTNGEPSSATKGKKKKHHAVIGSAEVQIEGLRKHQRAPNACTGAQRGQWEVRYHHGNLIFHPCQQRPHPLPPHTPGTSDDANSKSRGSLRTSHSTEEPWLLPGRCKPFLTAECQWHFEKNPLQPCEQHWGCPGTLRILKAVREPLELIPSLLDTMCNLLPGALC